MPFDRGFKIWAEKTAIGIRRDLKLKSVDPLDPIQLSNHLGANLITPQDISGLSNDDRRQLLEIDSGEWSAITLEVGNTYLIIYNPSHGEMRQSSDIMHELAHIIIGHEPSKLILSEDGNTILRTHDQKQEDEANWLGGCLLLPRDALIYIKRNSTSVNQICREYRVSQKLLDYRLNISGVNFQISNGRTVKKDKNLIK